MLNSDRFVIQIPSFGLIKLHSQSSTMAFCLEFPRTVLMKMLKFFKENTGYFIQPFWIHRCIFYISFKRPRERALEEEETSLIKPHFFVKEKEWF